MQRAPPSFLRRRAATPVLVVELIAPGSDEDGLDLDRNETRTWRMVTRLSSYPGVIVRIACRECPRAGSYRLARLAERYGAELSMPELLAILSADCPKRDLKRYKGEHPRCGAHWPDLDGKPEPEPPRTSPPTPALRIVGGRRSA